MKYEYMPVYGTGWAVVYVEMSRLDTHSALCCAMLANLCELDPNGKFLPDAWDRIKNSWRDPQFPGFHVVRQLQHNPRKVCDAIES